MYRAPVPQDVLSVIPEVRALSAGSLLSVLPEQSFVFLVMCTVLVLLLLQVLHTLPHESELLLLRLD